MAALVLTAVITTTAREVQWITRDVGRLFPAEWARFRAGVPAAVRDKAARDWCEWEDSHVNLASQRRPQSANADPDYRMCFAGLVTHYWSRVHRGHSNGRRWLDETAAAPKCRSDVGRDPRCAKSIQQPNAGPASDASEVAARSEFQRRPRSAAKYEYCTTRVLAAFLTHDYVASRRSYGSAGCAGRRRWWSGR